jgi:hypothetical protein
MWALRQQMVVAVVAEEEEEEEEEEGRRTVRSLQARCGLPCVLLKAACSRTPAAAGF